MTSPFNIIVAIIIVAGLALSFARLFKTKVWIRCRIRKSPMIKIGFLDAIDSSEVPEVHLPGLKISAPIGRVIVPDDSDNATVELQTENVESDSGKTEYHDCGFITPEGFIYKQTGKRRPEYIGYTACPSKPDTPTIYGERTWHSLWLTCTLNAYSGQPHSAADSPDQPNHPRKNKKKRHSKPRVPTAICSYTGFHNSKHDAMPPEARAAAFATIYSRYARKGHREYYNSPAYGWKDTALLASAIYVVAYTLFYLVATSVLGLHLIDFTPKNIILLCLLYFGIWATVRGIKIECVERSNSIQPRIDLLNKSLSQRSFDYGILFGAALILIFSTTGFYGLDLIPMAVAAIFGIMTNMSLRHSTMRWKIEDNFNASPADSDEDNQPQFTIKNPEGDIAKNYEWTLDSPTRSGVNGEATLYYSAQYIADLRYINPFFNQRTDKPLRNAIVEMFKYMNEHYSVSAHCRYLAHVITTIAAENSLTEEETLQFTLDFVQEPNITYTPNVNSSAINRLEGYIRFPDEVLFDKEADANSKALLAAALFHFMNRRTLFLYSRRLNHAAIAVEIDSNLISDGRFSGIDTEAMTFVHKGTTYIFCETTADGLRVGGTMQGMRPLDFDERIELPVADLDDDTPETSATRLYKWSLDSLRGAHLDGTYTLEFDLEAIESLRQINPFRTYGQDSNTYADNINTIFDYLRKDSENTAKVREIARYIKNETSKAGLPDIDTVQFALDFCQMPNIRYCVDDESAGINFAKEYMRFPDEVLFDKEGDCDCKSSLTAALFHELGYNVVILLSEKLAHAGIGVEFKPDWEAYLTDVDISKVVREYNGRRYLYCETTGDGYKLGGIQENASIHDFETIIEIPA